MRKLIVVFVLSACFCAVISAQGPILPDRFGAWQAQDPAKTVAIKDLAANWSQSNAEQVLQESGLSHIEQRTYHNGADELSLRLYQLHDPSSAYEFYTFLLTPAMKNLGAGEDSALGSSEAEILVGNFVVQASFSSAVKTETLNDLTPLLKFRADRAPFPPLKSYLPQSWRVFGSEKYALGPEAFRAAMKALNQGAAYADLSNEVGFQNGAEAIFARYQGQHGSGVLLLLEYPTPQVAENHKRHLEQALPAEARKSGVTVERKASLLSLVFEPTSQLHAQAIRDEVNYETQVTWDEPHQSYSDPPLVRVLYKIFLFTSLFLVVATMTGVAFGLFRVLIKHWWPGKVFDRPESIEVLQLGLSGKKIDPSDLY
jgi:hypothetical protein